MIFTCHSFKLKIVIACMNSFYHLIIQNICRIIIFKLQICNKRIETQNVSVEKSIYKKRMNILNELSDNYDLHI